MYQKSYNCKTCNGLLKRRLILNKLTTQVTLTSPNIFTITRLTHTHTIRAETAFNVTQPLTSNG